MIPEKVRFTGVTIPTADLLFGYGGRKIHFTPPAHWQRIEIPHDNTVGHEVAKVDAWLQKNIAGRWASYHIRRGSKVIVLFEDDDDALLFKLMGGETAWKEQESPEHN